MKTDLQKSGIYRIINLTNNKVYIGSAAVFYLRWGCHRSELRKNKHHSIHLQRAWNQYGGEVFKFEIIEIIDNPTKEILEQREQYWIDCCNSTDRNIGYNICKIAGTRFGIAPKNKDNWKQKVSKEEILDLYLSGVSKIACAKKFKIAEDVLTRILKDNNVLRTRSEAHKTPEMLKQIREVRARCIPWNKGLTKQSDTRIQKSAKPQTSEHVTKRVASYIKTISIKKEINYA